MKTTTLLVCLLFASNFIYSQEIVSTQRDSCSKAKGSIDFTIGEAIVNTGTDGTNDLTQGFHQTNGEFLGVEDHAPSYFYSLELIFENGNKGSLSLS
ncbi:MAG: hypothetical protein ACJAV5_002205 [Vicingaceae bacterium]|jgi:hypothetical protein